MDALAAALRQVAPIESPDEHTRFAPEAEASIYEHMADRLRARLAEQGYVLVSVEGLAAARGKREFGAYYPPRDDEWARTLLAALKDDAHPA